MLTKAFVWNVVIIFVVTFLLLEGSFRLYHQISPVFIFPDNSDNRFRNKPFDYDYDDFRLNSRGFKDIEPQDPKPQGSIRIAGIGDSFVYGVVPYKHNFLTLLEEKLNSIERERYEVLNMGIPRTSPREYYSVLVKEALPLKPDVALICIFIGNDFIEVSRKPVLHHSFVISAARYVFDWLRYVEPTKAYSVRSHYVDEAPSFSEAYFLEIELMRAEVYDQSNRMLSERLPRVMTWVDEIKTVCENNGIQLFIMLMPDELQVNTELQTRVQEKLEVDKDKKDKLDFDRPNKLLADELRMRNLRYLDLLEPFRLRTRDVPLYKPRDTHWNIAGNQLAADLLYDFLHAAIDERQGT